MKITVAGIGPGDKQYILPIVHKAVAIAEVVIGYSYYFQFVEEFFLSDVERIEMPLGKEEGRAEVAIEHALKGKNVLVIGSGDASIYSMASIVYEMVAKRELGQIELETLPGISAFLAAGSKLGAPLGHDFCCISLSDLMTPWNSIEKRIRGAAMGDFVTSLYNPRSIKRHWQLGRLKKIFLEERDPSTPVAIVRQVTRKEENIRITTLGEFNTDWVDMFSLVIIGNSQTFQYKQHLITPRGYLNRKPETGSEIQQASFNVVAEKVRPLKGSVAEKWALTRVIHTTGDLNDTELLEVSDKALEQWNEFLRAGGDIVTDVTMVKAGITKAFSKKYGNQIFCHLNDDETTLVADKKGLTRSQAGMQIAIEKHPNALYVVGNAPTALFEITESIRTKEAFTPAGVIGAPVGFINVIESKEQLSQLETTDWAIIRGNKGGSNLAASIVNAVFTLEEADNYYK
ncbi:MAG: precorrin-3B C(17)-methyltransferase [Crocinitomicaceae bacterium]|nr:precorrin-3B C(17)-methyltransferase [Crocinitomicaceae bacterium]